MKIAAIVAMSENRVIGKDGGLPWHFPEDLKRFSKLTSKSPVAMGRKTYESLPEAYRPLPGRTNIVFTRNSHWSAPKEVIVETNPPSTSIPTIIKGLVKRHTSDKKFWIIGGSEIYKATMPLWDELYLTLVKGKYEGDAFFPEFESQFKETLREDHDDFSYINYQRL